VSVVNHLSVQVFAAVRSSHESCSQGMYVFFTQKNWFILLQKTTKKNYTTISQFTTHMSVRRGRLPWLKSMHILPEVTLPGISMTALPSNSSPKISLIF
jgi:hypothetical protein